MWIFDFRKIPMFKNWLHPDERMVNEDISPSDRENYYFVGYFSTLDEPDVVVRKKLDADLNGFNHCSLRLPTAAAYREAVTSWCEQLAAETETLEDGITTNLVNTEEQIIKSVEGIMFPAMKAKNKSSFNVTQVRGNLLSSPPKGGGKKKIQV